jgi:hypothetical protein
MNRILITLSTTAAILAIGSSTAIAEHHEDGFKVIPVDMYACSYKDQTGPDDLDAYVKNFNKWADDKDMNDVSVWTLTPYYFGPGDNSDFDFIWMIAGKSSAALGKTHDTWLAENDGLQDEANKFANCTGHSNYASVNYKATPQGKTPEDAVLTFSDCNYDEGATFDGISVAMDAWSEHLVGQGSEAGIFHWYPVYGGGGEKFDFKWLESHRNFESMGGDFDDFGTGRGYEKRGELLGSLITCDASRVYRGKSRRFAQLR